MAKLWKDQPEKDWYQFFADGKSIGVYIDSKKTQKEISRLKDLSGIEVCIATNEALIKHNASTEIPRVILKKMG